MRYELFLRSEDLEEAVPQELLGSLSLVKTENPEALRLSLKAGSVQVVLHGVNALDNEAAPQRGFDVLIPQGASAALAAEALDVLFVWSEKHRWRVYDPQLGREVTRKDMEAVKDRIRRLSDYLTETVGLDDSAQASHIDVDIPRLRLTQRAKLYIGLAIGLTILALLAGYC